MLWKREGKRKEEVAIETEKEEKRKRTEARDKKHLG
jgi:hypothetical protein